MVRPSRRHEFGVRLAVHAAPAVIRNFPADQGRVPVGVADFCQAESNERLECLGPDIDKLAFNDKLRAIER
jgi:hypothetical protein